MNLVEYLGTEMRSFDELPFGAVDSAALAELAMANPCGIVPLLPGDAVEAACVPFAGAADGAGFAGDAAVDSAEVVGIADATSTRAGCLPEGDSVGVGGDAARADAAKVRRGAKGLLGLLRGRGLPRRAEADDTDGCALTDGDAPGFRDLLRAECFPGMFEGLQPDKLKEALYALAASPRFRSVRLRDAASVFDEERQNQFFAVTYVVPGRFAYLAFRGTDTSITGWRENFNMIYDYPVPAQKQALAYLLAVAGRVDEPLYLGGHSKGGNLALYAALMAPPEVQRRILRVYTHDAPGFRRDAIAQKRWEALRDRIYRMAPQESTVGLLMDTPVPLHVVHSTGVGIMQHSLHTWEVNPEGDGAFVDAGSLADGALSSAASMAVWLDQYSDEEARKIVESLFAAIEASGAHESTELLMGGVKTIGYIAQAARTMDVPHRDTLVAALAKLAEIAARGAVGDFAVSVGLRKRDDEGDPDALVGGAT